MRSKFRGQCLHGIAVYLPVALRAACTGVVDVVGENIKRTGVVRSRDIGLVLKAEGIHGQSGFLLPGLDGGQHITRPVGPHGGIDTSGTGIAAVIAIG